MSAAVSSRSWWLPLRRRFCTRPGPLYLCLTPVVPAQLFHVSVLLLTVAAVVARHASSMVGHPVTRPRTQHKPCPFPRHCKPVPGAEAHLPQQVCGERNLVLATYGGHGSIFPAANYVLKGGLRYLTTLTPSWQFIMCLVLHYLPWHIDRLVTYACLWLMIPAWVVPR